MNRYHAITPTSSDRLTMKSTSATTTVAVGMMSRGKYTLLMRWELPIRLADASRQRRGEELPGKKASGEHH